MADVTISALPTSAPMGNMVLPMSNGNTTYKAALSDIPVNYNSIVDRPNNAQLIRAWAYFNGKAATGTNQPIRASYNISSILRTDDNLYEVTFPVGVFSNTDYAFIGTSATTLNRTSIVSGPLISAPTATTFKFGTFSLVYTGLPAGWISESAENINIAFFAL